MHDAAERQPLLDNGTTRLPSRDPVARLIYDPVLFRRIVLTINELILRPLRRTNNLELVHYWKLHRYPSFIGQQTPRALSAGRINAVFGSIDLITDHVWPLVWLGMWVYDWCRFGNVENRYLSHVASVLFSYSRNYGASHAALGSNFGGDIPEYGTFWIFGIVYFLALSSGMFGLVRHVYFSNRFFGYQDSNIFFRIHYSANQIDSEHEVEAQLEYLKQTARIPGTSGSNTTSVYAYLSCIYANLKLSSLGYYRGSKTRIASHVIFYLTALPVSILAKISLWRLFIQKIIQAVEFSEKKSDCVGPGVNVNRIWKFMPETGNFECVYCDYSAYVNSRSLQGCIDALLKSDQNPTQIASELKRLSGYFSSISLSGLQLDASSLDWSAWSDAEAQAVFNSLNFYPVSTFRLANFSVLEASALPVSQTKIQGFAEFMKSQQLAIVDLTNVNLGEPGAQAVANGLSPNASSVLVMNDCAIGDGGALALSQVVPRLKLMGLSVSGNDITPYGVGLLMSSAENSTYLRFVNLSYNLGGNELYSAVGAHLDKTTIRELLLDGVAIDAGNVSDFFESVRASTFLRVLSMRGVSMDDSVIAEMVPYLSGSNVTDLDFFGNFISDTGFEIFVSSPGVGKFEYINIGSNNLQDRSLYTFIEYAQNFSPESMSIGDNAFTTNGLLNFTTHLPKTKLRSLDLSGLALQDSGAANLLHTLSNSTNQIRTLILNRCGITEEGARAVFSQMKRANISHLEMDDNVIGSAFADTFSGALPGSELTYFSMRDSGVNADQFISGFRNISQSSLEVLFASRNNLTDNAGVFLAQQMVGPWEHASYLGNTVINIDFGREINRTASVTKLVRVDMSNSGMGSATDIAMCRVLRNTGIKPVDLVLSESQLSCASRASSADVATPSVAGALVKQAAQGFTLAMFSEIPAQCLERLVPNNNGVALFSSLIRLTPTLSIVFDDREIWLSVLMIGVSAIVMGSLQKIMSKERAFLSACFSVAALPFALLLFPEQTPYVLGYFIFIGMGMIGQQLGKNVADWITGLTYNSASYFKAVPSDCLPRSNVNMENYK